MRFPARVATVIGLGLVFCSQLARPSAIVSATEPPGAASADSLNLLIIHTDEHNFRTLGCYRQLLDQEQALMWGEAVVETPHIDWIAKQGALCTSFYATTPVCSPSRGAFVSGRYPQNTPVTTNNIPLDDEIVTFAEILRRRGYATGYAGKWHLDGPGKPQWGPERKFGFEDNRYMFNRGHWKQLEITPDGPQVKARKNGKPTYDVAGADEKSFTTDFLADRAIEFIETHKDKPFCYMVSIPDPHGPDTVRPPYDTMYREQTYKQPRTFDVSNQSVPSWGAASGGFNGMASYYGMVKCIDDNVGRIIQSLRDAGVLERTVVVFTSDHGDLRGEHHRQNKGVPYEGSAKIPFLIYAPGKVPAGTVVDEALGCVDFLPTILSLLGQPADRLAQGRDASQLLMTGQAPSGWVDVSFIRSTNGAWVGAVSDRYKLILSPNDDPWLFDLQKDPDELKNFFRDPEYRQELRNLGKLLAEYNRKYSDPYLDKPKVAADLQWIVSGSGAYRSVGPPRAVAKEQAGQKNVKRKQPRRAKKRDKSSS